ncbi:MAG: SUMF1/EgtB/PvdO family nonheme iron enzyme [Spirochaetales bacterium]|nr:SUMF1/EgtB/PvdO family nonheme iron enzyme [Spirochaetales bacterium]
MKKNHYLYNIVLCGVLFFLSACSTGTGSDDEGSSNGSGDNPPVPASPASSSISFTKGSYVARLAGSGVYENPVSGGGNGPLSFTSSVPSVATVDAASGLVTLVGAGKTVITASRLASSGFEASSASYTLSVTLPPVMVSVPDGKFLRDSNASNETEMTSSYNMGAYEVTVDQYMAVTGLPNPSTYFTSVDNGPVQSVSFFDALVFCNRLSIVAGLTPVYSISGTTDPDAWGTVPDGPNTTWNTVVCDWEANGYRLPTRLEWYWAAMGATSDRTHGYSGTGLNVHGIQKYFSGNTENYPDYNYINDYVWYKDTSGGTTHPVGQKSANELGIYDMSGNVAELCWDFSTTPPYPDGAVSSDTSTGKGPATGLDRIVLGGYWNTVVSGCQIILTEAQGGYYRSRFTGFRVVRK